MVDPRLAGIVTIAPTAIVGEQCTFGCAKEARVEAFRASGAVEPGAPVEIGERCLLFNQIVMYEGARIGDDCVIEDQVRIGYNTTVGPRGRLLYGAYICDRVIVGSDARIAGFVCDGSVIGDRSTVMGDLVHEYSRPHQPWFEVEEAPPVINSDSVVGYGARIVGGVHVGPCSYVAAGAVVTKDVPPLHVVTGTNEHVPAEEWPGRRLQPLLEHWQSIFEQPAGG